MGKRRLPPRSEIWAIVGLFKTDIYLHYIHKTLIPTSTKSISTTRMEQFIPFRKTIGVDWRNRITQTTLLGKIYVCISALVHFMQLWPFAVRSSKRSQLHKMYQSQCTAKNYWWRAERLPETCRVVIPIKLEFSASVGFIHKESLMMHGHRS